MLRDTLLTENIEIARSVGQDTSTDTFHPSLCDTKLVWSFIKTGFVHSPLLVHLPQQFRTRPPDDLLPTGFDPNPRSPEPQLQQVMRSFLDLWKASEHEKKEERHKTPPPGNRQEESLLSSGSHMSASERPWAKGDDISPRAAREQSVSISIPSSPDTVAEKPVVEYEPEPRVLDQEPWVWANTLIANLQDLVKSKDVGADAPTGWPAIEGVLMDSYTAGSGLHFTAVIDPAQSTCMSFLDPLGASRRADFSVYPCR